MHYNWTWISHAGREMEKGKGSAWGESSALRTLSHPIDPAILDFPPEKVNFPLLFLLFLLLVILRSNVLFVIYNIVAKLNWNMASKVFVGLHQHGPFQQVCTFRPFPVSRYRCVLMLQWFRKKNTCLLNSIVLFSSKAKSGRKWWTLDIWGVPQLIRN